MDDLLSRGLDELLTQDRSLESVFGSTAGPSASSRAPTSSGTSASSGGPTSSGTSPAEIRRSLQEKLEAYIREIELFNPAYGLVGTESHEELVIKHILDSLAPLGYIQRALPAAVSAPGPAIADAGTGAGLPGLPLACALPACQFTLIERMGRRIGFLQNTLAILGLQNVRLEQADIEKARSGPFNLITFRAFRPLEPPMLKALYRLLAPGGVLAAYKGRMEKIREEMAPIEHLVSGWEALPVQVPFLNEERHLVIIRK